MNQLPIKLTRAFYSRETSLVAKELLGCLLVHRSSEIERVGRIVEVEAYLGSQDLASHSSKGLTKRNAAMFGPAGHAYVYLIYGIHHCFNIVTESEGIGSAVLIRAVEPISNIHERTNGPGLLTKAMAIDKAVNGLDLLAEKLFICPPQSAASFEIIATPRIGIGYAKDWVGKLLRFYIRGNAFISRP